MRWQKDLSSTAAAAPGPSPVPPYGRGRAFQSHHRIADREFLKPAPGSSPEDRERIHPRTRYAKPIAGLRKWPCHLLVSHKLEQWVARLDEPRINGSIQIKPTRNLRDFYRVCDAVLSEEVIDNRLVTRGHASSYDEAY